MRLISLKISNFRVIKTAELYFSDRVIGIIGPNGAGKSSIIEAIAYALYGNQATRSGKDEVKSIFARPDQDCEIELEFQLEHEKYRVIRRLVGKRERAEVELYRGDSSESIGVNETKGYVGQLLGLDWRGFLSSFLARQSELNALSDLLPSKRQDHIAGMLGIERLDNAIKNVKNDIKSNKDKINFLEKYTAEKNIIEIRVNELNKNLTDLKPSLTAQKEQLEAQLVKSKEITERLKQQQILKDKSFALKHERRLVEQNLESHKNQLSEFDREKTSLESLLDSVFSLNKEIEKLPQIEDRLRELTDSKSKDSLKKQLQSEEANLKDEISKLDNQLNKANQGREELLSQINKMPENPVERLNAQKEVLERERNSYAHLKAEYASLEKDLTLLNDQISSVTELGPDSICDRCLRPFGEDFGEIKKHLEDEIVKIKKAIKDKKAALVESEDKGKKIKGEVEKLEDSSKHHYQLKLNLTSKEKEITEIQKRLEDSKAKFAVINEKLEPLIDIEFDAGLYQQLSAEKESLDNKNKELTRLKGRLERLPEVEKAIEQLSEKTTDTGKKMDEINQKIKEVGFDESDFEKASREFQAAQSEFEAVKDEYASLNKQYEMTERELEDKVGQFEKLKADLEELEKIKHIHYHGEKLSNLFTDYRKHLIATIRPSLADLSSDLFNEMTGGKYSLVELDEKYNLRVMDGGNYYGVERFSGGEKDLANLCLRLAISLSLTSSAGMNRSFVILDEVFGSQDNERKELILRSLTRLKNRFPQILLVTHIDDIKDGVEQIIEVKPTGLGWSEISYNEN